MAYSEDVTSPQKRAFNAFLEDDDVTSPKKRKIRDENNGLFVRLFDEALQVIVDKWNVSADDISEGIETIIDSFRYELGHQFSDVDFSEERNLCAFFYRYSPISAGVSRKRVLDALERSEKLKAIGDMKKVKIISLGGGPGSDLIGLCSALSEKSKCLDLNLTVVEENKGWQKVFETMKWLIRKGNYGKISEYYKNINICHSFICENVENVFSNTKYLKALQEADIVWMKGLLSILTHQAKDKVKRVISENIKRGALMVSIDAPPCEDCGDLKLVTDLIMDEPYTFQEDPLTLYGNGICKFTAAKITVFMKV